MEASRKVGDRLTENPLHNTYLSYMTLPNSRIWMRYKARSIKGVQVNNKGSHKDLTCRFCDDGVQESQEHLETCGLWRMCLRKEECGHDQLERAGYLLEEDD